MQEAGLTASRRRRKSATVVGDVLGKYHPHGDASVYDAMVKMAQDFTMRYPLIIGQGNFGSIDGDGAAAYRYTEAKMSRLAGEMMRDIEKETVEFVAELRQHQERADRLAGGDPEPSFERHARHRGRHGDQHPAAQPARSVRRGDTSHRESRSDDRRPLAIRARARISRPAASRSTRKTSRMPMRPAAAASSCAATPRSPRGKKGDYQIIITSIPFRVNKSDLLTQDRRPRAREEARRHPRHARRIAPRTSASSSNSRTTRIRRRSSIISTNTRSSRRPSTTTSSRSSTACRRRSR